MVTIDVRDLDTRYRTHPCKDHVVTGSTLLAEMSLSLAEHLEHVRGSFCICADLMLVPQGIPTVYALRCRTLLKGSPTIAKQE
jgi:hypothetical protein